MQGTFICLKRKVPPHMLFALMGEFIPQFPVGIQAHSRRSKVRRAVTYTNGFIIYQQHSFSGNAGANARHPRSQTHGNLALDASAIAQGGKAQTHGKQKWGQIRHESVKDNPIYIRKRAPQLSTARTDYMQTGIRQILTNFWPDFPAAPDSGINIGLVTKIAQKKHIVSVLKTRGIFPDRHVQSLMHRYRYCQACQTQHVRIVIADSYDKIAFLHQRQFDMFVTDSYPVRVTFRGDNRTAFFTQKCHIGSMKNNACGWGHHTAHGQYHLRCFTRNDKKRGKVLAHASDKILSVR